MTWIPWNWAEASITVIAPHLKMQGTKKSKGSIQQLCAGLLVHVICMCMVTACIWTPASKSRDCMHIKVKGYIYQLTLIYAVTCVEHANANANHYTCKFADVIQQALINSWFTAALIQDRNGHQPILGTKFFIQTRSAHPSTSVLGGMPVRSVCFGARDLLGLGMNRDIWKEYGLKCWVLVELCGTYGSSGCVHGWQGRYHLGLFFSRVVLLAWWGKYLFLSLELFGVVRVW